MTGIFRRFGRLAAGLGETFRGSPRALLRSGCAAVVGCLGLLAGLALSSEAFAEGGDAGVFRNEEVTLQLVRAGEPVDGAVRAALLIDLAPGWHTYWTDPGASGVPPQIDLSKTAGFQTIHQHMPAPTRFGEGPTRANGYEGKAAFAFELDVEPGETIDAVQASVFLGVCKEICIPVSAELTAEPSGAAGNAAVAAAFAALPEEAGDGRFTVTSGADGKSLEVSVKDAGGVGKMPDLFVTAGDGWFFDEPGKPMRQGGSIVFMVPIAESPAEAAGAPETVDLLFTDGGKGVEATGVPVVSGR